MSGESAKKTVAKKRDAEVSSVSKEGQEQLQMDGVAAQEASNRLINKLFKDARTSKGELDSSTGVDVEQPKQPIITPPSNPIQSESEAKHDLEEVVVEEVEVVEEVLPDPLTQNDTKASSQDKDVFSERQNLTDFTLQVNDNKVDDVEESSENILNLSEQNKGLGVKGQSRHAVDLDIVLQPAGETGLEVADADRFEKKEEALNRVIDFEAPNNNDPPEINGFSENNEVLKNDEALENNEASENYQAVENNILNLKEDTNSKQTNGVEAPNQVEEEVVPKALTDKVVVSKCSDKNPLDDVQVSKPKAEIIEEDATQRDVLGDRGSDHTVVTQATSSNRSAARSKDSDIMMSVEKKGDYLRLAQERIVQLEAMIDQVKDENASLAAVSQTLQNQCNNKEREMEKLLRDNENLNASAEQEKALLVESIKKQSEEVEVLKRELAQQDQIMEQKIDRYKLFSNDLEARMQIISREKNKVVDDKNSHIMELQHKINVMESQSQRERKQIAQLIQSMDAKQVCIEKIIKILKQALIFLENENKFKHRKSA